MDGSSSVAESERASGAKIDENRAAVGVLSFFSDTNERKMLKLRRGEGTTRLCLCDHGLSRILLREGTKTPTRRPGKLK